MAAHRAEGGRPVHGRGTLGLIVWLLWLLRLESTSPVHRLVATSFILVPSALLFGASRLTFMTRRPWVLMLLGPVVFVVCFVGICDCAYRLHLRGA